MVGKTGTGKSYQALDVATKNQIQAIVDDGLLIFQSRILAGSSAKHEKSRIASVKRAIFDDENHAYLVKEAIKKNNISSVLILGTSTKMVCQIADRLDLNPIERFFKIEDIATPEEIETAGIMRNKYGNHIIPVPVFEVKKQFSGYFLKSLIPQGYRDISFEKTIIRPTYSYLGGFKISSKVFFDIAKYEALKIDSVLDVLKVKSTTDTNNCIDLYIELTLMFPCDIHHTCCLIQDNIQKAVEESTSITVKSVNVFVKTLNFKERQ